MPFKVLTFIVRRYIKLYYYFIFLAEQTVCLTLTLVDPSDIFYSSNTEDPRSTESNPGSPSLSSSNSSTMAVNMSARPENFNIPLSRMPASVITTGEMSVS